jgi:hypothetical protein
MKFKHLVMIWIASWFMVSCVQEVSTNQNTSNAATPIAITQEKNSTQSSKSADATNIKSGNFVSGEHTTTGTVRLTTKDGKSFIELEKSFKTSESGPDLVVILHRSDNVIKSTKPPYYSLKKGDYIVIAPLQKYSGAQKYSIPDNINLADYKSVAIWCRKFNATFGAATLSS